MQLIFENMCELCEMIAAMGYVKRENAAELTCGDITLRGSEQFVRELTDAVELPSAPPIVAGEHLDAAAQAEAIEAVEVPTKRKRRTKAEIEADKAAQTAAAKVLADEKSVPAATVNPLDNLKSDSAPAPVYNGDAHQAITETAGLFDGNDKLAHLNEGREFISKHGFALYNESQRLADVPPNIAAHTPEQVSRHRAAMAWLHEQQAKS